VLAHARNTAAVAGLRARGLAAEVRAEDLRFTTVETAEFLRRVLTFR